MRSSITNLYGKFEQDYPNLVKKAANTELKSFIEYNTHNINNNGYVDVRGGTDDKFLYLLYKVFVTDASDFSYLLDSYQDFNYDDKLEVMSFSIGENATCLRVNSYGFFLEKLNLYNTITTYVYDQTARNFITNFSIPDVASSLINVCHHNLNNLTPEVILSKYEIQPDFKICMSRMDGWDYTYERKKYWYRIEYRVDDEILDSYDYSKSLFHPSEGILYNEYVKFMQEEGFYDDRQYPLYIKMKNKRNMK